MKFKYLIFRIRIISIHLMDSKSHDIILKNKKKISVSSRLSYNLFVIAFYKFFILRQAQIFSQPYIMMYVRINDSNRLINYY